jgi:polyhydroxyalkanoate synthase
MSVASLWLSSKGGLPLLRSGLLSWRPELEPTAHAVADRLAAADPDEFRKAVDRELRGRADRFLTGLERYRAHPYERDVAEPHLLWSEGTTRLLDYAPLGGPPVLVVPSLVNRFYILDLEEERSLLRFLARQGLRPLVLDWGAPGATERGFTLTDYVAGRLEAALDAVLDLAGGPVALLGYCMGGTLALALAQRRQRDLAALALLAAPWDFHAEAADQARLLGAFEPVLSAAFALVEEIPVDVLQSLFFGLDPFLAIRKFSRFAALATGSLEARRFVALEDWLNDGVPLALPAARDCLARWYGANEPGNGSWRIAGRPVEPARVTLPCYVVVPARDRIVPPASASVLAELLPNVVRHNPSLGHIGMIVGGGAEEQVWRPLADWLGRTLAAGRAWTSPSQRL